MLKKNDELQVEILELGVNGEGIAKHENVVIFVPFALPGEIVKIKIINTKSSFYIAKLLEVVSESELRTIPQCPVFKKCGGCSLQHLKYESQLEFKTQQVKNNISKIAKQNVNVLPCVASDLVYGYRNKIQMPVGEDNNNLIVGMYRPNSHNIVATNTCLLQDSATNKIISLTNEFLLKYNISGYDEKTKKGLVRHIVARTLNNQILVTLVINGKEVPNIREYIEILSKNYQNFGLYLNINTQNNNVILGNKFVYIYGIKYLEHTEFDIKYTIYPQSFMQINNYTKYEIYSYILNYVRNKNYSAVIDAYSGAGLLSAMLSKVAKKVYGIEIIDKAVESANILKQQNKIENLINICGDCAVEVPKLVSKNKFENFMIVLDPPRKGCDEKVLNAIVSAKPNNIIYVSCNSATLSRDLITLTNGGYKIEIVQPYDMFPQTPHVETVCVLSYCKQ